MRSSSPAWPPKPGRGAIRPARWPGSALGDDLEGEVRRRSRIDHTRGFEFDVLRTDAVEQAGFRHLMPTPELSRPVSPLASRRHGDYVGSGSPTPSGDRHNSVAPRILLG